MHVLAAATQDAIRENSKNDKGNGKGKEARSAVLTLPLADVLCHSEADRFKPPSAYLWRSNTAHAWNGRLPPFRSVCRSLGEILAKRSFARSSRTFVETVYKERGDRSGDVPHAWCV